MIKLQLVFYFVTKIRESKSFFYLIMKKNITITGRRYKASYITHAGNLVLMDKSV